MYLKQKGISLLEVLVGFVIFTSSLIAVLDYVSGQVYHYHLSSVTHQKIQIIYELSEITELGIEQQLRRIDYYKDFNWTVSSSIMDTYSQRDRKKILQRTTHSVINGTNLFEWTVLNFSEES